MSKSTAAENSKIMLDDTPEQARKKIMSAATDSFGEVRFDMKERPGISNLLQIEALLNDRPLHEVVKEWEGKTSYGEFKKKVAETVATALADFQARMAEIPDERVLELLEQGEAYANEVANAKLLEAQKAVGLR